MKPRNAVTHRACVNLSKTLDIAKGMEAACSRTLKTRDSQLIPCFIERCWVQRVKPVAAVLNRPFPKSCRFKDAYCNVCGKKGHIARACKCNGPKDKSSSTQVRKKPSPHTNSSFRVTRVSTYKTTNREVVSMGVWIHNSPMVYLIQL